MTVPCNWPTIIAEETPQAQAIARWLRSLGCRSVVDLGCGPGIYTMACRAMGMTAFGFDSDSRIATLGADFAVFDLTSEAPLPFLRGLHAEAALCIEVAEHLPPEAARKIVVRCGEAAPIVVFSAAHPGQGGDGHVNCQPKHYWIGLFAQYGFQVDEAATASLIAAVKAGPVWLGWFEQNAMVLCK